MTTTRLPNGYTTASENDALGDFVFPDPTKAYIHLDDFSTFDATQWNTTLPGSSTFTLANTQGGILELFTDSAVVSILSSSAESFQFTQGKQMWFKISLFTPVVSDGVSGAFVVSGLVETATNNGVCFILSAAGITFELSGGAANISTVVTTQQPFQDTNAFQLGFYYDGNAEVKFYLNDIQIGSVSSVNVPFGIPVPLTFLYTSTAGEPQLLDIDYLYAAQER